MLGGPTHQASGSSACGLPHSTELCFTHQRSSPELSGPGFSLGFQYVGTILSITGPEFELGLQRPLLPRDWALSLTCKHRVGLSGLTGPRNEAPPQHKPRCAPRGPAGCAHTPVTQDTPRTEGLPPRNQGQGPAKVFMTRHPEHGWWSGQGNRCGCRNSSGQRCGSGDGGR